MKFRVDRFLLSSLFMAIMTVSMTMLFEITPAAAQDENTGPKIFNLTKEGRVPKRIETLKNILIDFENFCMKGCKYKISHVKTVKLLSTEETSLGAESVLWDFVDGWKKVKAYRLALVPIVLETGIWRLQTSLPNKETLRKLEEKYGLGDTSLFTEMTTSWELKEVVNESGEWIGTDVTYHLHAESDDSTIRMFPGQVLAGMKETANELFGHLQNATDIEDGN